MIRSLLWVVLLVPPAGFAQEVDPCNARCADQMSGCMQKCTDGGKCGNSCQNRMMDCMKRCQVQPANAKQSATNDPKKKCFGADGRKIACPDYKVQKGSKKVKDEDEAQFPNQAAKDLANNPEFKGAGEQ